MIDRPDFIQVGALVKVNGYVGRILDIAESDTSLMVRVDSAKCVRRFQRPDWLDYMAAPDAWSLATLEDLIEDAEHEKQAARKSVEAVEEYVRRVVTELTGSPTQGFLKGIDTSVPREADRS